MTLSEFASTFLEDRRTRSLAKEETAWRLHVEPHLGAHRLEELSPQHMAAWIEALKDAGELAPKSIRNVHGVLSTMLQQARFEGLVDDNAARALPRGGGQLHLDDLHAGREGVVDLRCSRVVASETELQNVRAEMVLL